MTDFRATHDFRGLKLQHEAYNLNLDCDTFTDEEGQEYHLPPGVASCELKPGEVWRWNHPGTRKYANLVVDYGGLHFVDPCGTHYPTTSVEFSEVTKLVNADGTLA